jgi:hypothetical protein
MKIGASISFAFVLVIAVASSFAADDPKTYKPDDEGYLHAWLLLDPVKLTEDIANHEEAQEKPVFDKEWVKADHKPKPGEKLKVGDKEYNWTINNSNEAILDLTQIFTEKDHEQCLFLGVAYIVADKELPGVRLSIGSDDSSVWKVNGQEVIRVYAGRDCEKDTDKSQPLTLKKGVNTVTFAITQGDGPAGAVARFVDKDDKPVKELTITLTPPAK